MHKLFIMCGPAFSGKSTLARKIAEHTGSKLIAFDKLWIDKEQSVPKGIEKWRFIRNAGLDAVLRSLNEGSSVVYKPVSKLTLSH